MKDKKHTEKLTGRRNGDRRALILKSMDSNVKSPMSWTAGIS